VAAEVAYRVGMSVCGTLTLYVPPKLTASRSELRVVIYAAYTYLPV